MTDDEKLFERLDSARQQEAAPEDTDGAEAWPLLRVQGLPLWLQLRRFKAPRRRRRDRP